MRKDSPWPAFATDLETTVPPATRTTATASGTAGVPSGAAAALVGSGIRASCRGVVAGSAARAARAAEATGAGPDSAGRTLMLLAAMLPVSSAGPNAVTHVPTVSALEVAFAVAEYVVAAVVGTVTAVVVAVPPLAADARSPP